MENYFRILNSLPNYHSDVPRQRSNDVLLLPWKNASTTDWGQSQEQSFHKHLDTYCLNLPYSHLLPHSLPEKGFSNIEWRPKSLQRCLTYSLQSQHRKPFQVWKFSTCMNLFWDNLIISPFCSIVTSVPRPNWAETDNAEYVTTCIGLKKSLSRGQIRSIRRIYRAHIESKVYSNFPLFWQKLVGEKCEPAYLKLFIVSILS